MSTYRSSFSLYRHAPASACAALTDRALLRLLDQRIAMPQGIDHPLEPLVT